MRDLIILFYVIATICRLSRPGGARTVINENPEACNPNTIKKPPCGRLIISAWLRGWDLNPGPLGYEFSKNMACPFFSSI
jgi:hypothetical protein